MPPLSCTGLARPLKRPQLSSGTQAFSHSPGHGCAATRIGASLVGGGGRSVGTVGTVGAMVGGNGAGVATASGSGRTTVVDAGAGLPTGRVGVWQPATNNASRLARNNRRRNNTRHILLMKDGDTSPLSRQVRF